MQDDKTVSGEYTVELQVNQNRKRMNKGKHSEFDTFPLLQVSYPAFLSFPPISGTEMSKNKGKCLICSCQPQVSSLRFQFFHFKFSFVYDGSGHYRLANISFCILSFFVQILYLFRFRASRSSWLIFNVFLYQDHAILGLRASKTLP